MQLYPGNLLESLEVAHINWLLLESLEVAIFIMSRPTETCRGNRRVKIAERLPGDPREKNEFSSEITVFYDAVELFKSCSCTPAIC